MTVMMVTVAMVALVGISVGDLVSVIASLAGLAASSPLIEMGRHGGFRRYAARSSGYDCRYSPCLHREVGEHGISSDLHWYFVTFGPRQTSTVALSVMVVTGNYPETVPDCRLEKMPAWLRWGFISSIDVHVRDAEGIACDLLDGACRAEIWNGFRFGDRPRLEAWFPVNFMDFEQSEAFWQSLERAAVALGIGEAIG